MDLRITIYDENGEAMLQGNIYQDGSDLEGTTRIQKFLDSTFHIENMRARCLDGEVFISTPAREEKPVEEEEMKIEVTKDKLIEVLSAEAAVLDPDDAEGLAEAILAAFAEKKPVEEEETPYMRVWIPGGMFDEFPNGDLSYTSLDTLVHRFAKKHRPPDGTMVMAQRRAGQPEAFVVFVKLVDGQHIGYDYSVEQAPVEQAPVEESETDVPPEQVLTQIGELTEDQRNIVQGLLMVQLEHTDLHHVYMPDAVGQTRYTMTAILEAFPFIEKDLRDQMEYRMPKEPDLKCPNCEREFCEEDMVRVFPSIPHLSERIEPGGIVPLGECPHCGSLVNPKDND